MPFFRMFDREIFGLMDQAAEPSPPYGMDEDGRISRLVDLTQKVYLAVERELTLVGFWDSGPARNKLRADLQEILLGREFAKLPGLIRKRSHIISRIMEIAESKNDIILYAE